MNYKTFFATAAMGATVCGAMLTPASAQIASATLNETTTFVSGTYTYSYMFSAPIAVNDLLFNFADTNVFFSPTMSDTGPLVPNLTQTDTGAGVYAFDSSTLPANTAEKFVFTSTDGPSNGSSVNTGVGVTGISYAGAGIAVASGIGPVAAPEPSALTSLAVLASCLGLGVIARRRKLFAS